MPGWFPPHAPGVQGLIEDRMERNIAEGDERPVKIGPLKVIVHFEHY